MILLQGKGVSEGIVEGQVAFLRKRDLILRGNPDGTGKEMQRLRHALQEAALQLKELAEQCRSESGDEAAMLFETHALLVEDEDYLEDIHTILREQKCSAEHAVLQAGERFAQMFAGMQSEYMQARAADIRDVSARIAGILTGAEERVLASDVPVILAADDLAPSETVRLDRRKILGFITREGSANSHTAILARTMGIPAVCALGDELEQAFDGRTAYVDGGSGVVVFDPDEQMLSCFRERLKNRRDAEETYEKLKGRENVTPDGKRIDLCCNIGSPEDVPAVLAGDGRGIGLFRSEFLYLSGGQLPTEEEQFRAYRTVAEAMRGSRVVIRTLDVGADKQADYLNLKKEENPTLGMRGVRFCLSRPEVFRTQLRALYRASAFGKIAIMFPMIASVWEVRRCRDLCRLVMAELEAEGIAYDRETELGVMIETPASVLIADDLAGEADFFSVGTNDLTQYTLACDRQGTDLEEFFDPRHPAVLRALRLVAEAAHRAGIWVGICGELAADPELLPFFLELGIDELSVSPAAVLPMRARLRNMNVEKA